MKAIKLLARNNRRPDAGQWDPAWRGYLFLTPDEGKTVRFSLLRDKDGNLIVSPTAVAGGRRRELSQKQALFMNRLLRTEAFRALLEAANRKYAEGLRATRGNTAEWKKHLATVVEGEKAAAVFEAAKKEVE